MSKTLLALFISSSMLLSVETTAEQAISGGESGYDKNLAAMEPSGERLSVSLAGEYPADISRFILASNQGARSARISPDGQNVAFIWSITGLRQVWIVPSLGGQPRQLTFGNGVRSFRWAPDGLSLFYGADNNGNEQEAYYKISVDGMQEIQLLPAAKGGFRRFGAFVDGNTIAYASTERNRLDFDIYIADLKTQEVDRVYEGKYGFFVSSASPDGRYLTIHETVGEDSDNLFIFDLQKRQMQTISKPERRANHSNGGVVWSQDGSGFYLASNLDRDYAALKFYSLEDGFELIHEGKGDIDQVLLCGKNSNYLVWIENDGGYSRLKGKNLTDGTVLVPPAMAEGVYSLDCQAGSDQVAVNVNGYKTPGDIFTLNLADGIATHTFQASLAGLDPDRLVKPESISMPARDGIILHGLLYLPPKENQKGKKPPVLFRVHGGPTAQSRPTFRASTQYLLGKGIAVFLPNVRGSTGYGHVYKTLDDRENRLDSIRDLVDMLAYLKKDGRVDASRAAVAGGSYGGYAVNAVLANFPGHFVAGASLYGVADWVTALRVASPDLKASDMIEYGDINEPRWLEFYTKNSPIREVENINVPVLYSHGVKDPRIDIYETEVMVKTLRKNGIEAPFIRFLDEGHGWRKLNNQLFYYRKEAEFLEQKLGVKTE